MFRTPFFPAVLLFAGVVACADPSGRDAGPDRSCLESCPDAGMPAVAGWDDRLGPWLRQARVQSAGASSPSTVAWSMINASCQDRSLLLQLNLMLAKDPTTAPLVIKESDLTDAFLNDALANPAVEVGSFNVTGPLMVEQCLYDPAGTPYGMTPWRWYWAYHAVPAVKVNGQWMILDLSVGDRPIAIDVWLERVVAASEECKQVDQATYTDVWSYWNVVLGSAWDPPAQRPSPLCAWIITSPLTFREGSASNFANLRGSLGSMEVQTEGFRTLMSDARLPSLSAGDVARVATWYVPMREKTFCARPEYEQKYCATLK